MSIERALIGTTDASAAASVYVEDVFSTYLYTGTGATQTITNGIDLSTKGGLVWLKDRAGTWAASSDHIFGDTVRGATHILTSNTTNADAINANTITAFNSNGFDVGSYVYVNNSGDTYVSWTFRKQPKFFDIVTYTGTGSARTISHNLGATPGMIIVKRTDTTANWAVYHKSQTSAAYYTKLNLTDAQASDSTVWNSTAPTSSVFSVGTSALTNANTGTYVAYLFADSSSGGFGSSGTDSVVACGSFTTDASGNASVTLGWEPQFILTKPSSASGNWLLYDNMRGMTASGSDQVLKAQASDVEAAFASNLSPSATGFSISGTGGFYPVSTTFIYLAIRRGPMKTPTDATKVFSPITANAVAGTKQTTGFPVDTQIATMRAVTSDNTVNDRLRGVSTTSTDGGPPLYTDTTLAEDTASASTRGWDNTGFLVDGAFYASKSTAYWNFRRAPGFFDVVCYTGTGSATTVNHGLGVAPEFMIVKSRSVASSTWYVCHSSSGYRLVLNTTNGGTALSPVDVVFPTSPGNTASSFAIGTNISTSSATFVAYLFASLAGVSKVGTYTGNGSSQTINCGFSAGARFVLIKRTDMPGGWYVWDTARGIVSANDPHLSLNTTAAEVTTDDSIDPDNTGFIVNQVAATNINVNSATYIYLAIA